MGKAFSALGKRATKPVRDFNIEERAHKAIMKETRPKAPRHESTAKLIEESVRNIPQEEKKRLAEKDSDLLQRLKSVYVTSEDIVPEKPVSSDHEKRPKPTERGYVINPEYGFHEPTKVPYGKITLKNALEAISRHQQDPELWTAKKISYEYKMDTALTEKMLAYFRTFVLIIPDRADKKHKITSEMMKITPLEAPIFLKQLSSGSEQKAEEKNTENEEKDTSKR